MFGAVKPGFRSLATLKLVMNVVGELFKPKRTAAASRGLLATPRLSCLLYYFNDFRAVSVCWHVAEIFLVLMWGPHFCGGPLFARTCWTCLNPPLHLGLVQPTYRTTHDSALAVLSVLSNFVLIWRIVSKKPKDISISGFGRHFPLSVIIGIA